RDAQRREPPRGVGRRPRRRDPLLLLVPGHPARARRRAPRSGQSASLSEPDARGDTAYAVGRVTVRISLGALAFVCLLSAAQCLALFRLEPVRTDDARSTRIGHRATRREGMTPQRALLAARAPARSRISSCADRRAQRQAYGPGGVGRSFAG